MDECEWDSSALGLAGTASLDLIDGVDSAMHIRFNPPKLRDIR